jgi:predicted phage terminase large subunit-like protein
VAFNVYIRQAEEKGKIIFPGNPDTYGFCRECREHAHGERLKCLECLKKEKTAHSYSSQYMNDPVDADSVEFKSEWIQHIHFTPELQAKLDGLPAILSIDPAVGLGSTNDYTGLVVCKVDENSNVFVLEAQQKRFQVSQLIDETFKLVKLYSVSKVLLETTSAQKVFLLPFRQEMTKRNHFFTIDEVGRSTKETKAMRIRGLLPYYANGKVWHRKSLSDLEYQMIQFPRNVHDDILDALAHQVPYWKKAKTLSVKHNNSPYGSLNWWKKQERKGSDRVHKLFGDLM